MSEEFVVRDRRLFSKDGQINEGPEAAEEAETGLRAEEPAPETPPENSRPAPGAAAESRALPPPTFSSLLVGLATSALIHLGETPEPGQEPPRADLPAAKHAIDLLGILKNKTKGNLEGEEEALLETLLYDLRLKFVKASQ